MSYTPGPWRVAGAKTLYVVGRPDAPHMHICEVGERGDERVEADARLIAAAPDLLDAAQDALEVLADITTPDGSPDAEVERAMRIIRKAIARATGSE